MRRKRFFCWMLAAVFSVCTLLNFNVLAVNVTDGEVAEPTVARATRSFSLTIGPGELYVSDVAMALELGEVISTNITYTPRTADVRFGVVSSEGDYYSLPGEDSEFDKDIEITERGLYYFAIQNNSSYTVRALGVITY